MSSLSYHLFQTTCVELGIKTVGCASVYIGEVSTPKIQPSKLFSHGLCSLRNSWKVWDDCNPRVFAASHSEVCPWMARTPLLEEAVRAAQSWRTAELIDTAVPKAEPFIDGGKLVVNPIEN